MSKGILLVDMASGDITRRYDLPSIQRHWYNNIAGYILVLDYNGVFHCLYLDNSRVYKLTSVPTNYNPYSSTIHLRMIYNRLYIIHVDTHSIQLYCANSSSVLEAYATYPLNIIEGDHTLHVADNILVLIHTQAKLPMLYDILCTDSPLVVAPLPWSQPQEEVTQVELDLSYIMESWDQSNLALVEFLLRRHDSASHILRLLYTLTCVETQAAYLELDRILTVIYAHGTVSSSAITNSVLQPLLVQHNVSYSHVTRILMILLRCHITKESTPPEELVELLIESCVLDMNYKLLHHLLQYQILPASSKLAEKLVELGVSHYRAFIQLGMDMSARLEQF